MDEDGRREGDWDRAGPDAAMTWPEVTVPTEDTLAWAARSLGPSARVRSAAPFSERSASWRLDVNGAEVATVVLRAGDPGDRVAEAHIIAEVAALRLAEPVVPAPRLIASDVTGDAASQLAVVSAFLEGSTVIPASVGDDHLHMLGGAVATLATIDPGDQHGLLP
jgi:hypothetical protein